MTNTYTPTRLYVKKHSVTGLRYFGKSIREDIETYKGSGKRWSRHLKKHNKVHVITEWISDWFYDKEELKSFALSFSEIFDIVASDDWANLIPENGLDGGSMGTEAVKKMLETMNNPEWKDTIGKNQAKKNSHTKNDPEWKATTGKESLKKRTKTINDPGWIEAIGKEAREKQTKSQIKTKNDPNWKATVGKDQGKKISNTKGSSEWKKLNSKTCKYCNKIVSNHLYKRWHDNNCKHNI
jgi:hypothetical protein